MGGGVEPLELLQVEIGAGPSVERERRLPASEGDEERTVTANRREEGSGGDDADREPGMEGKDPDKDAAGRKLLEEASARIKELEEQV